MKTAVEWLVDEMFKQGYFNDKPMTVDNINYFANIAKEMEKEQREKEFINGYKTRSLASDLEFDEVSEIMAKRLFNGKL